MLLSGGFDKRLGWGLLSLLCVAAALAAAPTARTAEVAPEEPPPGFCDQNVVRDFLAPLDAMPALRKPGPEGRLRFGPGRLSLAPLPRLVVDGGAVGYRLSLREGVRPVHPRWRMTTTVATVDRQGRRIEALHRSRRWIGTVSPGRGAGFSFAVGKEPALYRVTVAFANRSGRRLGSFGWFFRAMEPIHSPRLTLDSVVYAPGQTVRFRVDNYGTTGLSYGVDYRIEHLEGDAWVEAPESPDGPWIMLAAVSRPGAAGPCLEFQIPPTMPLGRYRVVKPLLRQPALTSEFHVGLTVGHLTTP